MSTGALILGAVAFVVLLVGMDRFAIKIVHPPRRLPVDTVPESGLEHEDFTIHSHGYDLGAWFLPGGERATDRPLLLVLHGWGASYGTVLGIARALVDSGHDVLLFDVRGHGRSPDVPFVTVRHFRDDVITVVEYARARFGQRRLVVVGHSMGGSAAVLAAADGADIDGLALIASPADVLEVTADFLTERGLPGTLMIRVLTPFWWPRVGSSFRKLTPHLRISDVRVPILVIQPENDRRVARSHADRLADAAGVQLHLIPGREHTDVLAADRTLALVQDFIAAI